MTIRCPKCRKKQEDPCPKRCGCGQSLVSLVTLLAGRRRVDDTPPVEMVDAPSHDADNDW